MVFRTSEEVRGEGFEMYSICFKPEEDLPSMTHKLMYEILHNIRTGQQKGNMLVACISIPSTTICKHSV